MIVQVVTGLGEETLWDSNEYAKNAYMLTYAKCVKELGFGLYDYYETIKDLIFNKGINLGQLNKWAKQIKKLDYVHKETIEGKYFIVVHAGYVDSLEGHDFEGSYDSIEEFYIYARDDAYISGGAFHSTVIAGHTPTILEEELTYNEGKVYTFYDEESDCTFYDIDCGGVYGHQKSNFAAIRLEDEKIIYQKRLSK